MPMQTSAKKIIKVGAGKIKSKILTKLSKMTGKNLTVPAQIYWNISNKCNFRCKMCTQWDRGLRENPKDYLSFENMKSVVDQMKKLKIRNLGITGGEPILQKELLFKVLEYANSQGIYTHFGTNGWLIDAEIIKQYDQIGGGHISLSIDAIGGLHDEIRSMPGAFEHAIGVLRAYKEIKPQNVAIKINTVMSRKNLDHILPLVNLAEKYGASIFIQPFEDFEHDKLYKDNVEIDNSFAVKKENIRQVQDIISKLKDIKRKKPGLILNSQTHLDGISKYFENRKNAKNNCEVAYKKFTIHPFGDVLFCGYLGFIGNIKNNSIAEIWNSTKAEKARVEMKKCRLNCMQGCFFEPGFFEMTRDGFYYLSKLLKK